MELRKSAAVLPTTRYDFAGSDAIMEFKMPNLMLTNENGLVVSVVATIIERKGNKIWQAKFQYNSKSAGRKRSVKEYKADNYKILKEEIEYASQESVSYFIEQLKGVQK
jgi:hypothetical protein